MNKKSYQHAFSRLEPSPAAVEQALAHGVRRSPQRGFRLSVALAAAALAVVLLSGGIFAAVQFHWFSLGPAPELSEPTHEADEPGWLPAPESRLSFEDEPGSTYVGFLLPESYREDMDALNSWKLNALLRYKGVLGDATLDASTLQAALWRYYGCRDLNDPECPRLTVEIKDTLRSSYQDFLVGDAALVKEDQINGMETVWVELTDDYSGWKTYCLFQNNQALGCIAQICSSVSFEAAEQAAADMVYVDSGVPRIRTEQLRYGLRVTEVPAGRQLDYTVDLEQKLAGAILGENAPELADLYDQLKLAPQGENTGAYIFLTVNAHKSEGAPDAAVLREGTLGGHEARWLMDNSGNTILQVWYGAEQVQVTAYISPEEITRFPGDVEALIEALELVPIPVLEEAPSRFAPFSVG